MMFTTNDEWILRDRKRVLADIECKIRDTLSTINGLERAISACRTRLEDLELSRKHFARLTNKEVPDEHIETVSNT